MTSNYLYNALGQRIQRSGGGGTVHYVYDEAGHLIGEYDGTGALIQETVWLGDTPVATLRPNGASITVHYVHTDHLNTPRRVTNASDNGLRWQWTSDAFGTFAAQSNPAGLGAFVYNLRFPGQVYEGQTGLSYNYFRDYDPAVGRYVESDPIGLDGGLNTYAYVDGNPLSLVDPLGQSATVADIVGAGVRGGARGGARGSRGGLVGALAGAAVGSAIGVYQACKDEDDFCYRRWEQEDGRCSAWSRLGGRVVAACKKRAADRRNLCYSNGGKPDPEEPPEYTPFRDYPR